MNSRRVTALLLVAVGGAAGSAVRATVALALPGTPLLATFLVNILGAFALAVLVSVVDGWGRRGQGRRGQGRQEQERRRERARLLLGTGFCGGFTTYSAVALHSAELLQGSAATAVSGYAAAGYAFGTLALGAVATLVGLLVGGRLGSRGARA